jgi:hypothetical protein
MRNICGEDPTRWDVRARQELMCLASPRWRIIPTSRWKNRSARGAAVAAGLAAPKLQRRASAQRRFPSSFQESPVQPLPSGSGRSGLRGGCYLREVADGRGPFLKEGVASSTKWPISLA